MSKLFVGEGYESAHARAMERRALVEARRRVELKRYLRLRGFGMSEAFHALATEDLMMIVSYVQAKEEACGTISVRLPGWSVVKSAISAIRNSVRSWGKK